MELEKQKNEAAITLIALVVTIIVLIILAGVSINGLAGDNRVNYTGTQSKFLCGNDNNK